MSAVPVSSFELLDWHEQRAALEADRRQVMTDCRVMRLPREPDPALGLKWNGLDVIPQQSVSVLMATRKIGEPEWLLLSGLWIYNSRGWREEHCDAPLPHAYGWEYRWMDEEALLALLPVTVPADFSQESHA